MNIQCPVCYGEKVVTAIVNDEPMICGCGECMGTGEIDDGDLLIEQAREAMDSLLTG